jgi:preprotein translocase subunit SecG
MQIASWSLVGVMLMQEDSGQAARAVKESGKRTLSKKTS